MSTNFSLYGADVRIGADEGNPLTTSVFDLPDHLAAKGGADPDRRRRAALRGHRGGPRADDRRPDRAAGRRPPGPAGLGQRALDRDQEIHRLTRRLRALTRFGLDLCLGHIVPGGRSRTRHTSDGSAWPTGRVAGCCSTGAARPPSRSSARPTPTRWVWPAAAGTAGSAAGSATTGTRSSRRRVSRVTPPRSTTSPRSSPAWAATARLGCATCSAPSRPTRTPSSARGPRAPSSSTAVRARARPSSPSTARRTCSTPTRGSATIAVACSSSARTSPTWPTSPTSCPASGRRACRPPRCATSWPKGPRPGSSAIRTSPG